MEKNRRSRFVALALVLFSLSLMMSCRSVQTGSVTNFPAITPAIAPLTADSYDIKGRVTGFGEVALDDPSNGDTFRYGLLTPTESTPIDISSISYNAYDVAVANATYDMIAQGQAMDADFLLFPTYTVENTQDGKLRVRASAVAASVIDR